MRNSRTSRGDVGGALVAAFLVLLFSLVLLRHDPLVFWNDDYQISILPVFADMARSWSEGHWPLLSPYSWVCSNLAGEFQYGTFSAFVNAAVVLIWKFPLTFAQQAAALSIVHLMALAAGGFVLARGRELSMPLSLFVGLVAALNGWIICWGASDWFGALGAFSWLPWAWWAMERALDPTRSRWRFLWPAPFVYLLVTGGFPYTVVMLAVLAAWLTLRCLIERKDVRSVLLMLAGIALGFGMSAPAWLALFDYVRGSGREVTSASAHWQWLVPPAALPAFIVPAWTVRWADFSTRYLPHTGTELACGMVPPVALLAGILGGGRLFVRRIRWELVLLVVLIAISMLPSAGVFRWSFRWLPLIHLVLVLCAAEALRDLRTKNEGWLRPGMLAQVLVPLAVLIMWLCGLTGPHTFPLVWILVVLAVFWAVSERVAPWAEDWGVVVISFCSLLATYLCIPPNCGVPRYNFTEGLTSPEPLSRDRLYLAVYSPAEYAYRREYRQGPVGQVARPGSTPMWAQLRFINGYSPVLPAGVARDFKFFIHGEIDSDMGKYLVESEAGQAGLLEELGVDGIVIAREIAVDPAATDWDLVFENDEGRVFHRKGPPLGLVRSVSWIDSIPEKEFGVANVTNVREERNGLSFNVEGGSGEQKEVLLTIARPFFRGYQARLHGKKVAIDSYRGLMLVIQLPAGAHGNVTLSYRPWWLVWGGIVAILSAVVWITSVIVSLSKQKS